MIEARKGDSTIKVSKAAYDAMFKDKGYIIIEKSKNDIKTCDIEAAEEVAEIPISEMNKEQLMQFAKQHNIDTSKAKNVGEARRIVQKAVREFNV